MDEQAKPHSNHAPLLLGCGILHKEIRFLIEQNGWQLDTDFLDSSLHIDLAALQTALQTGLQRHTSRNVVVFYGACHPRMEQMLEQAHCCRTQGQNCVEMLLGEEVFMQELSMGAFFLLEDWAIRWDSAIGKTFGKPEVAREIFQLSCASLLAIRTPCSKDFSQQAHEVSEKIGLPLRWMDANLAHLKQVLEDVLKHV